MSDLKRTLRLLKMLGALHGARFRTVGQLAERFGVSERTFFRDLADLSRDWPLESNPEGSGYRLPPGAAQPPVALTVEESALLHALLEQPIVDRDAALRRTARGMAAKLAAALAAFDETPTGLRLATLDRSDSQHKEVWLDIRRGGAHTPPPFEGDGVQHESMTNESCARSPRASNGFREDCGTPAGRRLEVRRGNGT